MTVSSSTTDGPLLQFRERRMQEACRTARLGYWEINLTEDTLWWSDVIYELLDLDPDEDVPSTDLFYAHIVPEEQERVRRSVQHARTIGHHDHEYRIIRSNGREAWIQEQLRVYRDDASGQDLITGVVQDITDLKTVNEQLKQESQRNHTVLQNIADGIIAIDSRGIITSFNPAASQVFGYDPDEVIGRNVSMLMPEPNRSAHDGYLKRYLETGEQRIMGAPREVEAIRSDGSLFVLELHVSEVPGVENTAFLGVVRDISERKRLEQMQNEFVSTVSHELRSPLTSIAGSLSMVAGGTTGQLPPKAQHMVGIAHRNANHLSAIINDLLDMEKLVSGKMPLKCQPVSVDDLVCQSLENIQAFADQHGVVMHFYPSDSLLTIRVDSLRFQQILTNFLSNAIKFSPANGEIIVRIEDVSGWVRVSVNDHGPGIPESFRDRIFQKFAQADSSDSRSKSGTGLGLAITRELSEQMGGLVDYESAEGEGATFYVEFPAITNASPE